MDAPTRHAAIVELLRREARGGLVPFVRVVEAALYAPGLGYYVSDRLRVGKAAGTDFTTAAALGPMFGELIAASARTMRWWKSGRSLARAISPPSRARSRSSAPSAWG